MSGPRKSRSGPSMSYADLAERGRRRIVVYGTPEALADLEVLEQAWGVTQSEVVRRALAEAAEREKKKK